MGGSGNDRQGAHLFLFLVEGFLAAGQDLGHGGLREVAAPDEPLVILFEQQRADEADQGGVVGEDSHDVGAPADLAVEPLQRVGGAQLGPVLGGERVEGQQVGLGVFEQPRDLRGDAGELAGNVREPLARLLAAGGGEDAADGAGDQRLLGLGDVAVSRITGVPQV